ncbi:single-strand DNA-binding protein [Catenuloplanes atrovinosus]|uniref:Single-strand DNA-binding protein n=1 Tax=Catenuloplanes atrovinosus TaxID=137266 RepID=A0AAE3YT63_9ACTN|nr:single-stranded DNA-binding protein [Catenuloplanes atrovinosus]MDR7278782.1 single-strand DNA-binding protein [Catenuloplanes atrovinosus]
MFDTYVTVVGNVLTAPEWRRTEKTKSLVTHFKVASTARKLDRETGQWVDGNALRVRVTCWRRLAEGVAASVMTGDPIIVLGRMYTRDWIDPEGNPRVQYELEAVAVGHDLTRGRSRFLRTKAAGPATGGVDDAASDAQIGGEATEPVPPGEVPHATAEDDDYEPPAVPLDRPDDPLAGEDLETALELDDDRALVSPR